MCLILSQWIGLAMSVSLKLSLGAAALFSLSSFSASAQTPECYGGKTIVFAGLDWESGSFISEVLKSVLSNGYGCKVDSIPGTTVTLEHALTTNEVQIVAETWQGRSETWKKAAAEGTVKPIGVAFAKAIEGWFVPSYMIKGDAERGIEAVAPDLKSVRQLNEPKYIEIFKDREEPTKARFLNCPSGWTCEGVNSAKLTAYGLSDTYVNFRPGTGAALDASIASASLRGEPMIFYYWSPTAIMGKYDLTQLEEPPFNEACWNELTNRNGKHDVGCGAPEALVSYGVNSKFAEEAPEVIAVLEKATFPIEKINETLAHMVDEQVDAPTAAKRFLNENQDIWSSWVSAEAKDKITAAIQ
jgi:glycine betaine/proline transport system substrate-binding protein